MAREKATAPVRPERRIGRKVVLISAGALAAVALFLLILCQVAGIHSMSDVVAYRAMWRGHYHPIWKDLALRRIKKGDTVESVLRKRPMVYREDAGFYTSLAYFTRGLGPRDVILIARDGKLVAAKARGNGWQHVFFESPEHGEPFGQAWMRFRKQRELEANAYKIHCAVTAGQDVFRSDHVERRQVPGPAPEDKEMLEQLKEIYGDRYVKAYGPAMHEELAVEVTEVLYGDLDPGTTLMYRETYRALQTSEKVFLHFEDDRALSPHAPGEPANLTVSKSALEWYQSLTPEQIQALVPRWSGR